MQIFTFPGWAYRSDWFHHFPDLKTAISSEWGFYDEGESKCLEQAKVLQPHTQDFIVCGFSLGSWPAMLAAQNNPRCRGMILFGGFARFSGQGGSRESHLIEQRIRSMQEGLLTEPEKTLRAFMKNCGGEEQVQLPQEVNFQALHQGLEKLLQADLQELAKNITCPTLLIHGKRDRIVSARKADELKSLIPSAQLELIEGGGHDLAAQAKIISPLIKQFLCAIQ